MQPLAGRAFCIPRAAAHGAGFAAFRLCGEHVGELGRRVDAVEFRVMINVIMKAARSAPRPEPEAHLSPNKGSIDMDDLARGDLRLHAIRNGSHCA